MTPLTPLLSFSRIAPALAFAALLAASVPSFPVQAQATASTKAPAKAPAAKKVSTEKSYIRFVMKHIGVPVEGRFRDFTASVAFDPKRPEATRAQFEVALGSIDLGNAEGEVESRRPLWFGVDAFPKATFTASSVKATGPGRYEAMGTLTIKGVSQKVASPFTLTEGGGARTVEGQFVVKRLAFKVGDKQWSDTDTIADEVAVRYRFVIPA